MGKNRKNTTPSRHDDGESGAPESSDCTMAALRSVLDELAPPELAEPWDTVGLISAPRDLESTVRRVVTALDLTAEVRDTVLARRAEFLVCYHPPLFKPLTHLRVEGQSPAALALELSGHGVAIYSPHTSLDVAAGGTNDCLAAKLGLTVAGSLMPRPAAANVKLVVFIPENHVEQVAAAVFEAGAGNIGTQSRYSQCSFRTPGTGTFFGDESTSPAVGHKGQLEFVPEIRFETIVPKTALPAVVRALRNSHPYEEPAFDLLSMETAETQSGMGRVAVLSRAQSLGQFARHCRARLKLQVAGMMGASKQPVKTVAILAGSAGTEAAAAMQSRQIDCLITGELKHHDLLHYAQAGRAVICLGHGQSEYPALDYLCDRIKGRFPALDVHRMPARCGYPLLWV